MFGLGKKAARPDSVTLSGDRFSLVIYGVPKGRKKTTEEKLNAYFRQLIEIFCNWTITSKEVTNFSYDISPLDIAYLPSTLEIVCKTRKEKIAEYIQEVLHEKELYDHYRENLKTNVLAKRLDGDLKLGRRIGWYAVVRALKPKVVVESGVDAGLGALALLAALKKNIAEGHPGRYIGIDISPHAGSLISGKYAEHAQMIHGDSIESINGLDCVIDLFVSDSDHSRDYERQEYEAVEPKLSDDALILADNAHVTDELLKFADRTGRQFLYFEEHPVRHWMRMANCGIGFCFPKIEATNASSRA